MNSKALGEFDDWVYLPGSSMNGIAGHLTPDTLQLDAQEILFHLVDVLDARDQELSKLKGLVGLSSPEVEDTNHSTGDKFGQLCKCIRQLREHTLVAADLACYFQIRAWSISQGSLTLEHLLNAGSVGQRLAEAGADVHRLLRSSLAFNSDPQSRALAQGMLSDDPLMPGLTVSGLVISDKVLEARRRRGIVPPAKTSQVRGLLRRLWQCHQLNESVAASEEASLEMERQLAELDRRVAQIDAFEACKQRCAALEAELMQDRSASQQILALQKELNGLHIEEIDLLERVHYWEEQVLSSRSLQGSLSRVRTQVRGHAVSLELADEQLAESEKELSGLQGLEDELRIELDGLSKGDAITSQRAAPESNAVEADAANEATEESIPHRPIHCSDPHLDDTAVSDQLMLFHSKAAELASQPSFSAAEAQDVVHAARLQHGPDSREMGEAACCAGLALLMCRPPEAAAAASLLAKAKLVLAAWLPSSHPVISLLAYYGNAASAAVQRGEESFSRDGSRSNTAGAEHQNGPSGKALGEGSAIIGLGPFPASSGLYGDRALVKQSVQTNSDPRLGPQHPSAGAGSRILQHQVQVAAETNASYTSGAAPTGPAAGSSRPHAEPVHREEGRSAGIRTSDRTPRPAGDESSMSSCGFQDPIGFQDAASRLVKRPLSPAQAQRLVQAAAEEHGPDSLQAGHAAGSAGLALLLQESPSPEAAGPLLESAARILSAWLRESNALVLLLMCYKKASLLLQDQRQIAGSTQECIMKTSNLNEAGEVAACSGLALSLLGRDGERLVRWAVSMKVSHYGEMHPAVAACKAVLAHVHSRHGAKAIYELLPRVFSVPEPDSSRSGTAAHCKHRELSGPQALAFVRSAKAAHGPDSLPMGRAAGAAGIALQMCESPDHEAAALLLKEAVRIHVAWLQRPHPCVFLLSCHEGACSLLQRRGDVVKNARDAVRKQLSQTGPDSIQLGDVAARAGLALALAGYQTEGHEMLKSALRIKIAWVGETHPHVAALNAIVQEVVLQLEVTPLRKTTAKMPRNG